MILTVGAVIGCVVGLNRDGTASERAASALLGTIGGALVACAVAAVVTL